MAYVTVVCGEVAMSDTPLREDPVNRTQEIVLKFQLVASSGEYCFEAALGWCPDMLYSGYVEFSVKCTTVLSTGEEILWSFHKRMSDTLTSQL